MLVVALMRYPTSHFFIGYCWMNVVRSALSDLEYALLHGVVLLGPTLAKEFGLIFECYTMTGEAHEQLHNYLLPIHHQLRDFTATEAQGTALGAHLVAYSNYFE